MPIPDSGSAKPDVQTPNDAGVPNKETRDPLRNEANEAPTAPKTSGGAAPEPNPLSTPADLRDAGMPKEPMSTDEPRTGR